MTVIVITARRVAACFGAQRQQSVPCDHCGNRLSQHRWGDNACPNPMWRCGNGQPQWLTVAYRTGSTGEILNREEVAA